MTGDWIDHARGDGYQVAADDQLAAELGDALRTTQTVNDHDQLSIRLLVTPCDRSKVDGGNVHRCAAQRGHDFDLHICACGHRWGDAQTINPQAIQP